MSAAATSVRFPWPACAALCRATSSSFRALDVPSASVPEEDVHAAIQLALRKNVILVAFGDMLRVPANVPKREPRSLEQARAAGGDVRPIASPREAVKIASANPGSRSRVLRGRLRDHDAPVAALVAEGLPPNLSLLLSGRLTWPAVAKLLDSEEAGFDALIAPGHVATIMGPEEWAFVPEAAQHSRGGRGLRGG